MKYLCYVIKHRWFVMVECFRVGLYWRGITHDLSKLHPAEFFGYLSKFGGNIKSGRDKSGGYAPTESGNPAFEKSWRHHFHVNDHHWEYWVTPNGDGTNTVYQMSENARLEMVCDWRGASRAIQGTKPADLRESVIKWYSGNSQRVLLHPETRAWVREALEAHQ